MPAGRVVLATQFEIQVRRLLLTTETYLSSVELHRWCEENRNRCYIPEWLLDAWDIVVEPDLTGAAYPIVTACWYFQSLGYSS